MKAIIFTDQELDSMIEMYKSELELAQIEVAQIQEILKKLGALPAKKEVVEKEPKVGKKRGRKPSLKVVEKDEPKKRGRKPKVVVPTPEAPITIEPLKKVEIAAKVKRAYNKKVSVDVTPPVPTVEPKSVPTKAPKVAAKVKKEAVKPEPKPKKIAASKTKAEKEPAIKPAPKRSLDPKFLEKIKGLIEPEPTDPKKEEVKKLAKKKVVRKSKPKGITLVKLSKPLTKKVVAVEPVVEIVPAEPPIEPTEQS